MIAALLAGRVRRGGSFTVATLERLFPAQTATPLMRLARLTERSLLDVELRLFRMSRRQVTQ